MQATVAIPLVTARHDGLGWYVLPRIAQFYVAYVIVAGAVVLAQTLPTTFERPFLFACCLSRPV